ncbi:MAG: polyprenyl synthetase family protein [Bacillota bacterium]|uniref:Polyprenyl synthetase family protein n=1 Tax=Fictibacillus norfolkensis TaxID=2762233 RepID=A0ABR8SMK4_9BACL|nr:MULTISPECIES: polyprenyl synthetase family protein [Fictibacillus]MBD7964706.1 polyprenyl synthetase family protein [Fictibacillus norfolkensis]MBH0168410.1 polyprenyl synthetase family protein [Fictibacillus sp. 18YEL24]
MKLKDLYSFLKKDLQQIEDQLVESVRSDQKQIHTAGAELLKAGGKRIRPVFVLLSAQFGTYNIHQVKKPAAALELIHMASLVHDDVVDDADMRRGRKTVKAKYDNKIAMYTGDFIFASALKLMSEIEIPRAHQILAQGMKEMCLGEIEQINEQYDTDQNIRKYFKRIKRKTALLIALSCQLGAITSKADVSLQKKLYDFGFSVGMAFQITDDILDFTASEKQLGKPAGSDLKQGNLTLPVLYTIYQYPEMKEKLDAYYDKKEPAQLAELLKDIKELGGIDYATKISDKYLKRAKLAAESLPETDARDSLLKVADYIAGRKF